MINIIGSALLFAVLLHFLDLGKIAEGFSRIQPTNIYLAGTLSVIVLLVASVRWWVFVRAARFPHSFWVSVRVRLIAQLLNMVIPSGVVGDGLQVFLVSRRPKLSGPLALATILADRLIALLVVIVVLLSTARFLAEGQADIVYLTLASSATLVAVFVGFMLASKKRRSRNSTFGRFNSIVRFAMETMRAVGAFKDAYTTLFVAVCLAMIGVLANTAIAWILISDLADVQFWQLIPTFCLVMLSGLVPATFSGMGVREWIFFANLNAFGLSLEESVALSLALFGVLTVVGVILAALAGGVSLYRDESTGWLRSVFRKPVSNA